MNADKVSASVIQAFMRNENYRMTQVDINLARQTDPAVASLHVPEVLSKNGAV